MRSIVADRINAKLIATQKELDNARLQSKTLEKTLVKTVSVVHHDEFEILKDGTSDENNGNKGYKFLNDLNTLRKDQDERHTQEAELKAIQLRIKDLEKEVDHLRFWRDRADTLDTLRQLDAERHIFG